MDPLIRDDMIHSVDQTLVFYGKKLDKAAVGFWLNALRKFDLQDVKRALMIYTERGKYAPKPVDIIEILDNQKAINRAKLPPPAPPRDRKSTDLDRAWIYVIKWIAATGKGPAWKGNVYRIQSHRRQDRGALPGFGQQSRQADEHA